VKIQNLGAISEKILNPENMDRLATLGIYLQHHTHATYLCYIIRAFRLWWEVFDKILPDVAVDGKHSVHPFPI
jgi:hypothetical protein